MAAAVAETLAGFVNRTTWETLPSSVQMEAKRALLNFIACALAVADEAPIEKATKLLAPLSGPPQSVVVGRPERLDGLSASFVNAIAGNFLDFDDTHLETVIHPTAPVAPVCLALAERDGLSGMDLLLALALGMETACRIGCGVSPGHYARGWHITATCGVFGAAAAAAKLMRLTPQTTADALGVAASEASGVIENLSTAAKNVGVGNAARNGLFAAMMARAGYAASPTAIEGRFGWARAMGDEPDVEAMTSALGARWEILKNTYKPYPAGVVFHAVIDACLALRAAHGVAPEAVRAVVVCGDQLLLDRGDRPVGNERDARVSIHHCAAVALLFGAAGLREFSPEAVRDPAVVALREKVRAELAPELPRAAARVEVRLADGRTFSETVLKPLGGEARPLANAAIEAKLRASAPAGTPVDQIIDFVWRLDEVRDLRPFLALLGG